MKMQKFIGLVTGEKNRKVEIMAQKTYREQYDEIYRRYPEELQSLKKDISNEIEYEFIEPYYIKNENKNCIDYGKIMSKVRWPDEKMRSKLDRADLNKADDPVPFLIAGTVVRIRKKDDGLYKVYISDDEELWNNPDDYDRMLHVKDTLEVQHCIVAFEMFTNEERAEFRRPEYSIGNIGNIRPGTRVMMTAFNLAPSENDNWLLSAFSDIKSCSADLSRMRRYYDVCLDVEYKMITQEEYYQQFFAYAQFSDVLPESLKGISQNNSSQNIQTEGCYIATCVYGSYDCPQVWTLRRFRDFTLYRTWYGRAFIQMYYRISPKLVKWFGGTDWFKTLWRGKLDELVKRLQDNGMESTPYKDRDYY